LLVAKLTKVRKPREPYVAAVCGRLGALRGVRACARLAAKKEMGDRE